VSYDDTRERGPAAAAGTVLVVDDNRELRYVLRKALERVGFRVLEAGDGEEALRAVDTEAGAVDLVLADVVMPRMGGRELVWRLSERSPQPQVVLLSGVLQGREPMAHLDAEPAAFIEKPFDLRHVVSTVQRLVGSPDR
jgi:CheY-like chemotaxis protein